MMLLVLCEHDTHEVEQNISLQLLGKQ